MLFSEYNQARQYHSHQVYVTVDCSLNCTGWIACRGSGGEQLISVFTCTSF